LAELRNAVVSGGLVPTLDTWTAQLNRQAVLDSWFKTSTWAEALDYLGSHGDVLRTPEVFDQLAQSEQPVARVRAAIQQLAESLPLPKIEQILTSTEAAVEVAQDALERADLPHIYSIAVANHGGP
jgi:hypothetical protein